MIEIRYLCSHFCHQRHWGPPAFTGDEATGAQNTLNALQAGFQQIKKYYYF
jgi:hypothetical protein